MSEARVPVAGVAVGIFRVVTLLHAALAVVQPIAAGALLDASSGGLTVHQGVGGVLILVGMIQVPATVLAWRPGHLPFWPVVVALGLVIAEILQVALGYAGSLGLHVPLGVAIVAGVVALAVWSLRARPDPRA